MSSEYQKALENPKTLHNANILLENLSEANCRKYCEEDGNCFDCYINFEQVQALDFIREQVKVFDEFEEWLEESIAKMKRTAKVLEGDYFCTADLEHSLSIRVLEMALVKLREMRAGEQSEWLS